MMRTSLRKIFYFIKEDYFEERVEKIIFQEIASFALEYDKVLTPEILSIEIQNREDLSEQEFKDAAKTVDILREEETHTQWLLDTVEKWCRDRAIYLALMESISIADGNDSKKTRDAIPSILSDALAVSFDNHIGHDYLEDYEQRYESYHKKEDKIPFDLDYFNKITKVVYQTKRLMLLWLALVLVRVCSCVISQVQFYSKERMCYTSRLRWLRENCRKNRR